MNAGKFHYAWVIAAAGLLMSGAGIGIFNSCTGVFIKPVCEDLGFLRGEFTLYSSISTLICVILMPVFGTLLGRFGFRKVALTGAIVCGSTMIGFSFGSQLWYFYLLGAISGLFVNGVGIMAIGIVVNKWFIDRKGIATGIAYSGSGLLAAALTPLSNYFIGLNGWRWTYRFLGGLSLAILIPVILFLVKDNPEVMGLSPYRSGKGQTPSQQGIPLNTGLSRKEALRTPTFWLLAIAVMGITLCQAGPHVHTVSFLSDVGYSSAYASAVSSVYMILLTASKIIMGFVFDKLGSLKGSLLIGGCCAIFPLIALAAAFPLAPWLYALTLSLASSGATILSNILTANYFGRKDFSGIYSLITMFSYAGVAISSPMLGAIYDKTGSYSSAWILICALGILVCVCLILAYRKSQHLIPQQESEKIPG